MELPNAGKAGATPPSRKRKRIPNLTPHKPISAHNKSIPLSPSVSAQTSLRRTPRQKGSGKMEIVDLASEGRGVSVTECEHPRSKTPSKRGKSKAAAEGGGEEKRLRRYLSSLWGGNGLAKIESSFRSAAPQSYQEKLERALTQRMFVIGRTRGGSPEAPEETIDLAGTTGNIYQITVGKEPRCTCPDNTRKGNQCKHIIYVLVNVLKAPDHLRYQLAFLSSELREIFDQAPAPVAEAKTDEDHPGKRKAIEGPCPVCFLDLEADTDEIVWCKAACGNNIHKHCFEQWAASQRGKEVKCVYCRTPWQGDVDLGKSISTEGILNEEGYVNVADQLGLSGRRDYSSYHQHWVRRTMGGGYY
ncbi:MAG: hypothetical protein M1812_006814 [Candelaria pacifica]|nr:MAG: hypothetical protein M1812_006814 [Candelaria pacifica]